MVIKPFKKCCLCGKRFNRSVWAKYCFGCAYFCRRMNYERIPSKDQKRIKAYIRKHGFVCEHTGVDLVLDNPKSPWYVVFDHYYPHSNKKIVLACSIFNQMKKGLVVEEFWNLVGQLASHHKNGTPVEKIELKYWDRVRPRPKHIQPSMEMVEREMLSRVENVTRKCSGCGQPVRSKYARYCRECARLHYRMRLLRFSHKVREEIFAYIRKYGKKCYYTSVDLDMDNPNSPWYAVF